MDTSPRAAVTADTLRDRIGLCSVTYRQLSPAELVAKAVDAGLRLVEWGTDGHVLLHDPEMARQVRRTTEQAGLRVASLGSYFRVGVTPMDEFDALLDTAEACGAARIRIWAGDQGSDQLAAGERQRLVAETRELAAQAAKRRIELAFEYHGNTLTDSTGSAVALLEEVDHPSVGTYWQPAVGVGDDAAIESLQAVLPWLRGIHVFSWWPRTERLRLSARSGLWRRVAGLLRSGGVPVDLMLEFVPGDDPAILSQESAALIAALGDH